MRIMVKKFGDILTSRPDGREAFLGLKAYTLRDVPKDEEIIVDFDGVQVLTPSWADEFVTPLFDIYKTVRMDNAENASVKITLDTLREYSDVPV